MIASIAILPCQKYNTRWIIPLQQLRKGHFDATDADQQLLVAAEMATIPVSTLTDPAATISYYVTESVNRVKALFGVHQPNRGKGTRYWCPSNVALDIILRMVVQLRRLLTHPWWSSRKASREIDNADQRLQRLARGDLEQFAQFNLLNEHMLLAWQQLDTTTADAIQLIAATAYASLKNLSI